jgi:electron transfer flavoprotein alpha subunit
MSSSTRATRVDNQHKDLIYSRRVYAGMTIAAMVSVSCSIASLAVPWAIAPKPATHDLSAIIVEKVSNTQHHTLHAYNHMHILK